VWEWCYDVDSSGYISEETPYIYDASQLDRRLRGGSWNENVENCTYFIRANEKMDSNSNNIGFRIVRTI
ncbi:SUMF1/EgtB/PvdO family nonheme iron enzyme, partial [Fusobacterium polymorphum]